MVCGWWGRFRVQGLSQVGLFFFGLGVLAVVHCSSAMTDTRCSLTGSLRQWGSQSSAVSYISFLLNLPTLGVRQYSVNDCNRVDWYGDDLYRVVVLSVFITSLVFPSPWEGNEYFRPQYT
jgi:hypothetical protein